MNELVMRAYVPGSEDRVAFRVLNEEWIARHFALEAKDVATLGDPEGTILAKGGRLLVAELEGAVVGCVALIPMGGGVVELSKMAVSPGARGRGLGRRVLLAGIAEARAMGARRVFLGSNTKLADAVHLYEAVGFRHVARERLPEMPYQRANVFMEMELGREEETREARRRRLVRGECVLMKTVLVTGGSGFFGGVLKRRLLREGFRVVNVDLVADGDAGSHPELTSVVGDIRDEALMERLFAEQEARGSGISAVMHCAAMLAHEKVPAAELWSSNVDGTRVVGEVARRHGVRTVVFTSTNCLWAEGFGRPVTEADEPKPVELYGRSKLEGERVLRELAGPDLMEPTSQGREVGHPAAGEGVVEPTSQGRDVGHPAAGGEGMAVVIIRCPTIIDSGRLGLLAILFEFIDEGRKVWVVGDGGNRYQFIYAEDLATACIQAMEYGRSDVFHIGSDEVPTLRAVYEEVIRAAGTRARVARLPRGATVTAMRLAHRLGVSPLGPYHYRMIAESFVFDTARIRERLGWQPTVTNGEMMVKAYRYYAAKRKELEANREGVSAHSRPAAMGVIRLLKWVS